jgi:hypothetical protein
MCSQVPRLNSETNTDISAYLSDPYSPPLKCVWCQPKPRVNALTDRRSSLLQGEVFLATKCVERTDRGGQKFVSKYECARRVDSTCHIELRLASSPRPLCAGFWASTTSTKCWPSATSSTPTSRTSSTSRPRTRALAEAVLSRLTSATRRRGRVRAYVHYGPNGSSSITCKTARRGA